MKVRGKITYVFLGIAFLGLTYTLWGLLGAVARLFCGGGKMDGKLLEFCHHIYQSHEFPYKEHTWPQNVMAKFWQLAKGFCTLGKIVRPQQCYETKTKIDLGHFKKFRCPLIPDPLVTIMLKFGVFFLNHQPLRREGSEEILFPNQSRSCIISMDISITVNNNSSELIY